VEYYEDIALFAGFLRVNRKALGLREILREFDFAAIRAKIDRMEPGEVKITTHFLFAFLKHPDEPDDCAFYQQYAESSMRFYLQCLPCVREPFATLSRDHLAHLEVFTRQNAAIQNYVGHLFPQSSLCDEFGSFDNII
jgi:hypothetical protein